MVGAACSYLLETDQTLKERATKKTKPTLIDQIGVNQEDSDSSNSSKGTIRDDVSWAELAFGQSCVNSQNGSDNGEVKAVKKKKSTLYKRNRETFTRKNERHRRTTLGKNNGKKHLGPESPNFINHPLA